MQNDQWNERVGAGHSENLMRQMMRRGQGGMRKVVENRTKYSTGNGFFRESHVSLFLLEYLLL